MHLSLQPEIVSDCPQEADADPLYEETRCTYSDASD